MNLAAEPKQNHSVLYCPKCKKFQNTFVIRLNDVQFMHSLIPSDFLHCPLVEKRCASCKTVLKDKITADEEDQIL